MYMPTTLPGLSVSKAAELLQTQDRIIKSFSEVASVYGKAGRASTATDPPPVEMIETVINLRTDPLEYRHGLRSPAADRGADDRRDGVLDRPDACRYPRGLRRREGLPVAATCPRDHPPGANSGTSLAKRRPPMMQGMMGDGSMASMMWGMGLFGLVLLVIAILAAAALVKYLFF
jgi:hypothetical protein